MSPQETMEVLRAAGISARGQAPHARDVRREAELIERARREPDTLAAELIRSERQLREAKQACAAASEAAAQMNELLQGMVEGAQDFWRLVAVRETADGQRAVCQVGGKLQELAIHSSVDLEELRGLESWEYIGVRENVVVGTWRNDPALFANAHGEIATFKNYVDRASHLVEVSRDGHDDCIVELSRSLHAQTMTPHTRLVLQRDNPHRAIAIAAGEDGPNKFELSLENIQIRLDDLAGVEDIVNRLFEDIALRLCHADVVAEFGLQGIRGVLLHSFKPGMGKSKCVSALARRLYEEGLVVGFDVVLYEVKPNETKIVWHGGDAKIVRELWSHIRARQSQPRSRPLLQIVVFDEVDSLGRRGPSNDVVASSAQNDALEALLAEMDGLPRDSAPVRPPAHVLCFGMTTNLERLDGAAKRPGRFGDLVLAMPGVTLRSAEDVMAVYARGNALPWHLNGEVCRDVAQETIRAQILRPALARVFPARVITYKTDTQQSIHVSAGEVMANVHFMDAMNAAKRRAALRRCRREAIPAVTYDDVVDCLIDSAVGVARQMEADPQMMIRQLQVKVPVTRVDSVDKRELADHRYLRMHSA